jgi:hypothetical protein
MEEGLEDVSSLLPWQRSIVAPSRIPAEDHSEPPDALELEFVYGFSADRNRQSVQYAPDGDAVYIVGAIGVVILKVWVWAEAVVARFATRADTAIPVRNRRNDVILTSLCSGAGKNRILSQ